MAYNFSLKKYANGTLQLTYYYTPIFNSMDYERQNCIDKPDCFTPYRYDDISAAMATHPDMHLYEFGCDTPFGFVEPENIEFVLGEKVICSNDSGEVLLSDEEIRKRHEKSVSTSLTRSVHKIYDLGRNNVWEWFFTFTLNETAVKDRCDYDECSKKVRVWFNNVRKRRCPDIKYLIVPEKHPSSGAWHFHALVSNCDGLEFKNAINNQEYWKDDSGNLILDKKGQPMHNKYFGDYLRTSYPSGDYIYNIVDFNEKRYGFTTATRVKDTRKAISYIMKYLTKELAECTFGKKRFFYSKNLEVPEKKLFFSDATLLQEIIDYIETNFNVTFEKDYIKTVKIQNYGYQNTVSYLEFSDNVSRLVPDHSGAAEVN